MPIVNFKADLLYGASGLTKTTNIGLAAKRWYEKTGKVTRLVSADGGGWGVLDALVEAGIVVPWAVRSRSHLVETLDKTCQGYWPEDPENPHSPLQAPTVVNYVAECYRCKKATPTEEKKWRLYGPAQAAPTNLVCPTCKAVVGPRDIDIHVIQRFDPNPLNRMTNVAVLGIEGLTSFGDTIINYLMSQKASLSQDPSFSWVDGSTTYSGGNQTYYGFAQLRLYEYVMKSHMIPFVDKVIWTALEGRGEEEGTKIPIFGPSIAGKKATGKASQWFGNTMHFDAVPNTEQGASATSLKPMMYLRNHADPLTKIPFQCKVRAPLGYHTRVPDSMEPDVAKLYDLLDKLKAESMQGLQQLVASKGQVATAK